MATETIKDTVSTNGSKPAPRKGGRVRKLKSIGSTSADSLADVSLTAKVDTSGMEWTSLPTFATFSTSPDGSFPKVKDSRSSYIDLKTQTHEIDIASGRVYRVYL